MVKKLKSIVGVLGLAGLVLAGCTGGQQAAKGEASSSPQAADGSFKVALITPGSVSDAGWNAMAFAGLQAIESELGAEITNAEATGAKIRDVMRTYAQEDYKLIFGHGFEYNAPGVELAKQFPNTVFISSSGAETATNAGSFRFYLEQGFYLAGMMGAKMSKNKHLAMVGLNVPSIVSTFRGFEAGAKAVDPNIKVTTVLLTDTKDAVAVKQATLQVIEAGADMIIHQANEAARSVFDACKEKGAMAFGSNADQNGDTSGVVLASAVIVAKPAFVEVARQVKEGKYQGGVTFIGMDKGAIDFIVNPAKAGQIPDDVKAAVEQAKQDILAGKIVVPKDEF